MWEAIIKYYGIDWIAMILNALSIHLLGKKLKLGFFLGVVANLAWIAFAVLADSAATVIACSIFVVLNARGWWNWTRDNGPNHTPDDICQPVAGSPKSSV